MRTNQQKDENLKIPGKSKKTPGKMRRVVSALSIVLVATIAAILFAQNVDDHQPAISAIPPRALGPDSAPVTITEYADFGCITCQAWHQFGVREQILDHYGDQVQFFWRDFPVTSRQSLKAAEAGFCAHDQGRFWDYHHILFENAPALAVENLKTYAQTIGLDRSEFDQCLDSGKHQQAVENELANARELGLRGVPSFIVNGKRLLGPPSFEQLAAAIDEILASRE